MNVLNPVTRIKEQFRDAMKAHGISSADVSWARAKELFATAKLPERFLEAYPHQLSGGMRQRAVIALAVCVGPKVVLLDEPTTALDPVVQRSVARMLDDLRSKFGLGVVFVTHGLSLLVEVADRVEVMYAGQRVEEAHRPRPFTSRPGTPSAATPTSCRAANASVSASLALWPRNRHSCSPTSPPLCLTCQ